MKQHQYRGWHEGHPAKGKYEGIPAQMFYDTKPGEILNFLAQGQKITPMQCTGRQDYYLNDIYAGDIIKIDDKHQLTGVVRQTDGGQWYIDHKKVNMKYSHQIHCEICETDSPVFFIDFFEHWELHVIGNIYENPELAE